MLDLFSEARFEGSGSMAKMEMSVVRYLWPSDNITVSLSRAATQTSLIGVER